MRARAAETCVKWEWRWVEVFGWSGNWKAVGREQNLQPGWDLALNLISPVYRAKTKKRVNEDHLSFRHRKWKKIMMISLKIRNEAVIFKIVCIFLLPLCFYDVLHCFCGCTYFFSSFFWLHGTACGILVSPTRDRTHAPCSGSTES